MVGLGRRISLWEFGMLEFLLALAAAPQDVPDRCRDDRGKDRCAVAAQDRMRGLYSFQPIEEAAESGATIRRIMYVDGYGRDLVAVEFVRGVASDPTVRIIVPHQLDWSGFPSLQTTMDLQSWEKVLEGSRNFHRNFESKDDRQVRICVHGWVYSVEAVDQQQGKPLIRTKVEDACVDGPAAPFATEAANVALSLFPPCLMLDRSDYRNAATILSICHKLIGDRFSAAAFLNRVDGLNRLSRANTSLPETTSYRLKLDWQGERASGKAAKELLQKRLIEAAHSYLIVSEVRGIGPRDGVAIGTLNRNHTDGAPAESAQIAINWDLRYAAPVTGVRVGPWKPISPPSE